MKISHKLSHVFGAHVFCRTQISLCSLQSGAGPSRLTSVLTHLLAVIGLLVDSVMGFSLKPVITISQIVRLTAWLICHWHNVILCVQGIG